MLFATLKMYQVASTEAYDNALKAFSAQLYAQKPATQNKVDFLLERFCALPDIIDPEGLKAFTQARAYAVSRFVMTQQDFVQFIEHFYFLLTTEDTAFKITPRQKQAIKKGLSEVYLGTICEPGKVTRLNSLFLESRTDLQWIPNELLKQRLNKIQFLADRYNQEFGISAIYSLHTVNRMQQLAKEIGLGVKLEVTIDDVHMLPSRTEPMDDYFKAHYIQEFKAYQTECIDGLTTHLWDVFTTEYRPRFTATHGERVQLTVENSNVMSEFVRTYLLDEAEPSLETFVDELDEFSYSIKPDDALLQAIKNALIKKLQKDGFFISSENLNRENSANVYFIENHDKKSQGFQAFVADFSNRTQFIEQISANLLKHADFFLEHPEFIVDILSQNPSLWDSLPRQLRQNHKFIVALIKSLKLQALDDAQQANIRIQNGKLLETLLIYRDMNPRRIRWLPQESFKQEFLKSPLNLQICQKIILQNREYSRFFDENYPITYLARDVLQDKRRVQSIFQLQQMAHRITPAFIDSIYVNGRSIQGLSPSAFGRFGNALTRLGLNWNDNEYLRFKERLPAFTSRHQFAIDSEEYDQALLLEALHMHNNWVDALIYFQQHITVLDLDYCSTFSFEHQLQLTWEVFLSWANTQLNILKLISDLVKTIAIRFLCIVISQFLFVCSYMILTFPWLFLPLCLIGNFAALCAWREYVGYDLWDTADYPYYVLGGEMLILLLEPEVVVYFSIVMMVYQFLPQGIAQLCQFFNMNWSLQDIKRLIREYLYLLISYNVTLDTLVSITEKMGEEIELGLSLMWAMLAPLSVRGFLNLSQVFQAYTTDRAILDIENEILRLELSDTLSGLQKADILRQIWGHVSYDLNQDKTLTIQEALDTPHAFNFKGKNYQMSYRQVAAIKRQNHTELDLDAAPVQSHSWFSAKTDKVLRAIPANLSLGS
jgi:hypothetical protein